MSPIPRWEWRAFFPGNLPRHLETLFTADGDPPAASEELYVVSSASPHNVKVRGGRLEIKQLVARERGLERWRPTLKASFPIEPPAIHAACEAWGIPAPVVLPRRATLDELLRDVVEPMPILRAVRLRKRRTQTLIAGCTAEHAVLEVEGQAWHTVAVEDTDQDRLLEAVDALGLGNRANTSYPAALKAMAHATPGVPLLP